MAAQKRILVTLEQSVTLPFRKKSELTTRTYTVWATTKKQAVNAVKRAGHKGKVVEVIIKK